MDDFFAGLNQPVTAPLYPDPPYYYRGAKVILGIYSADTEKVARHLPPGSPTASSTWAAPAPASARGSPSLPSGRPGKRLLTVTMNPERPATMEDVGATPHLTLRYIPGAEEGSPSVCELIRTEPATVPCLAADGTPDIWSGRCQVSMDSPSAADPLQDLAPTAMIGGIYGTFDWTLPQGRVVHDYLAEAGIERSPAAVPA